MHSTCFLKMIGMYMFNNNNNKKTCKMPFYVDKVAKANIR